MKNFALFTLIACAATTLICFAKAQPDLISEVGGWVCATINAASAWLAQKEGK